MVIKKLYDNMGVDQGQKPRPGGLQNNPFGFSGSSSSIPGQFTMPEDFSMGQFNQPLSIPDISVPDIKLPSMQGVSSALDKQFGSAREALNIDLGRQGEPAREQRYESLSERGLTDSGLGDRINRLGERDLQQTQRQAFLELQSNRMAAEADLLRQRNQQQFDAAIQSGNWQQAADIENRNNAISVRQLGIDTANLVNNIRGTDAEIWLRQDQQRLEQIRVDQEAQGLSVDRAQLWIADFQNRLAACGDENQQSGDGYQLCRKQAQNDILEAYGDIFEDAGINPPFQYDETVESDDRRLYDAPGDDRPRSIHDAGPQLSPGGADLRFIPGGNR